MMMRVLLFVVFAAAAIAAAVWLAGQAGMVTLRWPGWRADTPAGVLVLAVLVIAVAVALLYRAWGALRTAPRRLAEVRRGRRRRRGYEALTRGMVAVAAGDVAEARAEARRADNLLDELPLTMLLSAQAAQLDGDEAAARKYFAAMLERPETEFLGLRGLLLHAGREGDSDAAFRLANRAYRLKPNAPWVLNALFDLQIRKGEWRQAENVVRRAVRRKVIPRAQGRRRRAILFHEQSLQAEAAGQGASALELSRKAFRLAPGMVEVAARLASWQTGKGAARDAMKTIEKAWARAPHPDLGRLYAAVRADEDALARVKRFEKLLNLRPDHLESHAAFAEVAVEAKLWGTARGHLEKALGDISGGDAPARIFRMMAALEEAEHDDKEAAEAWLMRAGTAKPDEVWLCRDCHTQSLAWTPMCQRCQAFDTLEWLSPSPIGAFIADPPLGGPAPERPELGGGTDVDRPNPER